MEEYAKIYKKIIFDEDYKPDKWQIRILEHDGNMSIRCGRQVGKSVTVAKKATKCALEHDNINILILAAAQRQSSLLFEKVYNELIGVHEKLLEKIGIYVDSPTLSRRRNMEERRVYEAEHGIFQDLPTKTEIRLKNGTRIYSLPAGKSGMFIRGLTIDILIQDEGAFIPEAVWTAVGPMIAVSKKKRGMGWEIILSTPFGKGGHFYETQHDDDYLQIHVTSEQCPRISSDFLRKKRISMTKMEYAQEYLAEFIDEFNQMFPTELIKKCMTFMDWSKKEDGQGGCRYYLGVDFAGYGGDENAFVICEYYKDKLKIVKCFTTERISSIDTIGRIFKIDEEYNFAKIFVDDGGLGSPITDALKDKLGRKVTGLNNSRKKFVEQGEERKAGILKEDLYTNSLMLMETGKLELINSLSLLKSMKSVTFEYTKDTRKIKIFGKYTHLAEAMVRACWCVKERGLKLYIA